MPVVLKIDTRHKVVYSAFYGKITDAELLDHRARIGADPDFNPGYSEIVDFSAVTEANISNATLSAMASAPSLYDSKVKHIVVAPSPSLVQMMSKFKDLALSSRPNMIVVRTRDEAYERLKDTSKAHD
jgi:hypothetical protein